MPRYTPIWLPMAVFTPPRDSVHLFSRLFLVVVGVTLFAPSLPFSLRLRIQLPTYRMPASFSELFWTVVVFLLLWVCNLGLTSVVMIDCKAFCASSTSVRLVLRMNNEMLNIIAILFIITVS
jgi:hypothetical protein